MVKGEGQGRKCTACALSFPFSSSLPLPPVGFIPEFLVAGDGVGIGVVDELTGGAQHRLHPQAWIDLGAGGVGAARASSTMRPVDGSTSTALQDCVEESIPRTS